jgi:hypothetical protein
MHHNPYTLTFQASDHVSEMVEDARRYRLLRASRDDHPETQAPPARRRWLRWAGHLVDRVPRASKTRSARPDPAH